MQDVIVKYAMEEYLFSEIYYLSRFLAKIKRCEIQLSFLLQKFW